MREFWEHLEQTVTGGRDLLLVTIIASSGATPRGAGARMLVDSRSSYGTIGGGAVELNALQMARELLVQKKSLEQEFTLQQNDVQDPGMVCGGTARIYFHYIPSDDLHTLKIARNAIAQEAAHEDTWLVSDLENGGYLELYTRENVPSWLTPRLKSAPCCVRENGKNFYVEQIVSAGRVYIFGGGHVARALEPVLSRVGFSCVVLDDRQEFADPSQFPTAELVKCISFDRIDAAVSISTKDYVCVMTRGHAADLLVESQVLRCHPRYNGMIGSRAKASVIRQALQEEYGFDEASIAEIISPIGLPIGGKTPEEIAISIAAEMIAVRSEKKLNHLRAIG